MPVRTGTAAEDRLSVIFAALADPTRRAILARLADGDATVSELAEPFSISMPAISRHLKVLERAGLISRSRSGQWRSSTLEATALKEATDWMERYRVFWDASLDRLDAHLRRVQQGQPSQPAPPQRNAEDSSTEQEGQQQ
jgi:DNA-binding transcriptional ArsR family regulator